MFSVWVLLGVLALYMAVLFLIALWGDRQRALGMRKVSRNWVYSLALAVYCTSWTFNGAVGRAADSLWSYLPIYLGPLLIYTLGLPILRRIYDGVQHHNLTSIADFIAARYGRDRAIASLVTIICVVAIVPYIALQLHGIAIGVDVMATDSVAVASIESASSWSLSALVSAASLAVFAILFGTRHISSRESQQGLLLAVAFESLIKLIAFVAVGVLAWTKLGELSLTRFIAEQPKLSGSFLESSFLTQTLLAGIAIMCLPRQFHVGAVEYTQPSELRLARWVFPGYLVVISIMVLPIVAYGLMELPAGSNPDSFVLLLPKALDEPLIALLVFLGGVSAASAMVIVSSIALGTMISNELVLPRLLDSAKPEESRSYTRTIKRVRRCSIVIIVALAYAYYLRTEQSVSLAATGLLAFVGIAQLAPAMLLGLFWGGATRRGAMAALSLGALLWFWIMLLPVLAPEFVLVINASQLPSWLTPGDFMGLSHMDGVSRAAWSSLSVNFTALIVVSLLTNHRPEYYRDAGRFLLPGSVGAALSLNQNSAKRLLTQFFGKEQAGEAMMQLGADKSQKSTYEQAEFCERMLSGVMGAATARRLVEEYSLRKPDRAEEVLSYASEVVDFSRELLQASLQNIGVAVSVIDSNQRLVAWNSEYQRLFGFQDALLKTGVPIEKLVRFNATQGLLGKGDPERLIAKRLAHLRAALPYKHERALGDDLYLEIRGAPMPGGGFITTFTDISNYKKLQHTLEQTNASLEARVSQRTIDLEQLNSTLRQEITIRRDTEAALNEAKALAEKANASKTHFLAAATHDLMQPLNSARLFAAVLAQQTDTEISETANNIEQSLESMEQMLSTLLDISKLDAGVLPVNRRSFLAEELLQSLYETFVKQAEAAGVSLSMQSCRAMADTDPSHLYRVLQNFLVNALRYSGSGSRIVLGARRQGEQLRFEVWDNGPGISEDQQELIFEEFKRGADRNSSDDAVGPRGAGLGLSISRRLAALLGHDINLKSTVGKGSVFSITVPRVLTGKQDNYSNHYQDAKPQQAKRFKGLSVLCVDNEPQVLKGMNMLLTSWGCEVVMAEGLNDLDKTIPVPELLLVDFHLEHGVSGAEVIMQLRQHWQQDIPAVLITADYTEEAQNAAAEVSVPILRKPLKPASLGALMSRLVKSYTG